VSPPAFARRVRVRPEDIDDLGHANNVHFLRWILEAATGHWDLYRAEAPASAIAGIGWVVIRHVVDYLAPAFAGDELDVFTWVPTCTATTCDRYAEVVRVADGGVLARSVSTYCVVDQATGRPRRLSEELRLAIGGPEPVKRQKVERLSASRPTETRR